MSTFVVTIKSDNNDLYSSTYEMSRLFTAELQFVDALKSYSESKEKFSDVVNTFLQSVYSGFNPGNFLFHLHYIWTYVFPRNLSDEKHFSWKSFQLIISVWVSLSNF